MVPVWWLKQGKPLMYMNKKKDVVRIKMLGDLGEIIEGFPF